MRSFLKSIIAPFTNLRNLFDFGMSERYNLSEHAQKIRPYYFAHCWFICNDFHPLCIPACAYVGRYSFTLATRIAFLQTLLILLHEIGHVVLGHYLKDGSMDTSSEHHGEPIGVTRKFGDRLAFSPILPEDKLEIAADKFAFENLLALEIYEHDLNLFAALSLADHLRMFEATTIFEVRKSTYPSLSKTDQLTAYVDRSMGQAFLRREFFRRDFEGIWKEAPEKSAYQLFTEFTDDYIKWLPCLTQEEIDELTNHRDYMFRR